MYDRFTDRARKVMQLANHEAMRFKHEYIGSEHILLGLMAEGTGVAGYVLKNLGLDLGKIRSEVEKLVGGPIETLSGKLPQTPSSKRLLEFSIEEAHSLQHNYVGTEHLLLGLVRDEEGLAAQVLINLGLSLHAIRQEVLGILGNPPDWTDPGLVVEFAKHPADPNASTGHLPEPARKVVAAFDSQIAAVRSEKENSVAACDFEKAAKLREIGDRLKKLRAEFIQQWPEKA